jgi:hypothetical protein
MHFARTLEELLDSNRPHKLTLTRLSSELNRNERRLKGRSSCNIYMQFNSVILQVSDTLEHHIKHYVANNLIFKYLIMNSPPNRCHIHHGLNQDDIYGFHEVEHQDKYHKHHNETSDPHEF